VPFRRELLGCTIALLVTSSSAFAEKRGLGDSAAITDRVDTHLQRGIEFYAEKQYELAIVEFRAGFAIDPRAEFLFALAQAERLSGDCPTAIVYYNRFLETQPTANQDEAARVNMKRCTRALESGPGGPPLRATDSALAEAEAASSPAPPPVPEASLAVELPRRADDGAGPWYRDAVGTSLAAGSLAGLGLGVGFWVAKGSAEEAAADAEGYQDYVAHIDRAKRNRTLALLGVSTGAALAGVAIYRFVTRTRKSERQRAALLAGPTSGGAFAGIAGSF